MYVQIKFLKSKEGAAMVQLGDGISVERAIQNLHNCFFFGSELRLRYVGIQWLIWVTEILTRMSRGNWLVCMCPRVALLLPVHG